MQLYPFDDDYVRRLQEGDRATVDHFFHYFNDLLLIKLRGKLRSLQAVDDVRQETYARVFRTLRGEGVRDGRRFGKFVVTTCNNIVFESFRSASRTEPLADDFDMPSADKDVIELIITAENRRKVLAVLDRMPPKDAAILRALFIDEIDKDDVCRMFEVDRAYLRVLLHRAKERFRAEYKTPIGDGETFDGKPSLRG